MLQKVVEGASKRKIQNLQNQATRILRKQVLVFCVTSHHNNKMRN